MRDCSTTVTGFFPAELWRLLAPFRWRLLLISLLVGLQGAAMSLQNALPKWLFSYVLLPSGITQWERWWRVFVLLAAYLLASCCMRMIAWHLAYKLFCRTREAILLRLRSMLFAKIVELESTGGINIPTGELQNLLLGPALPSLTRLLEHAVMSSLGSSLSILITLGLFINWDVPIGIILILCTAATACIMIFTQKRIFLLSQSYDEIEQHTYGFVFDRLKAVRSAVLHSTEQQLSRSVSTTFDNFSKRTAEKDLSSHRVQMTQELFTYLSFSLLLLACAVRYTYYHVPIGVVAACLSSFAGLLWPLQSIYATFQLLGHARASAWRVQSLLSTLPLRKPTSGPMIVAVPSECDIRLTNVTFSYDGRPPLIHSLSFDIRAGQFIGIRGPSGVGKTTLVKLLLQMVDPQQGEIYIAGIDIRRFDPHALRAKIAVIPQDPFMMNASVMDNLLLARSDATPTMIEEACTLANCWNFVRYLPSGLDEQIGEDGMRLSGGQRQRIAIARALLMNPSILICDEAASAQDEESERSLITTIKSAFRGRTVLWITHRKMRNDDFDQILTLRIPTKKRADIDFRFSTGRLEAENS